MEALIKRNINIDEMPCGFMPGRCTIDAIFILRQLQEYMAANKPLFLAFVDLEKAFDRVPRKIIWWAMRKVGVGVGAYGSGYVCGCEEHGKGW